MFNETGSTMTTRQQSAPERIGQTPSPTLPCFFPLYSTVQSPHFFQPILEPDMAPIIPGARRKRDDDSDSTAATSMRPVVPKPRKRRKTIMSAFNNISLGKGESAGEEEDADSSQAVGDPEDADGDYSSTSSLEDDSQQDEDERFLSDKEEAAKEMERKVMLELVFGPGYARPQDPVDLKLEQLMQKSLQKQTLNLDLPESQDDMNIETPYSRSSIYDDPPFRRTNSMPNMEIDCENMEVEMEDTSL